MLDFLFKLGIFLLPFDNIVFAPSSGWATLTPIIFFIYTFINFKKNKVFINKIPSFIFIVIVTFLVLNGLVNEINISKIIDSLQSIILGISTLLALNVRYIIDKRDYRKDIEILLCAYKISIVYGITKYLTLKFNIVFFINIFKLIEKRYYSRVAFTFTEPSFISLHIYGVLLILYFIIKDNEIRKKIIKIILAIALIAFISKSSGRFFVDTIVIIVIIIINEILTHKQTMVKKIKNLIIILICGICLISIIISNPRIQKIINGGSSADLSMESRTFRINSTINGMKKHPFELLIGKGFGGTVYFFNEGYDETYSILDNYKNYEIKNLKNAKTVDTFCLYLKFLSEAGIIAIFLLIGLMKKCYDLKVDLRIVLISIYIYIQFDSYTWYTLYILLFYINYLKLKNKKV